MNLDWCVKVGPTFGRSIGQSHTVDIFILFALFSLITWKIRHTHKRADVCLIDFRKVIFDRQMVRMRRSSWESSSDSPGSGMQVAVKVFKPVAKQGDAHTPTGYSKGKVGPDPQSFETVYELVREAATMVSEQ